MSEGVERGGSLERNIASITSSDRLFRMEEVWFHLLGSK